MQLINVGPRNIRSNNLHAVTRITVNTLGRSQFSSVHFYISFQSNLFLVLCVSVPSWGSLPVFIEHLHEAIVDHKRNANIKAYPTQTW